MNDSGRITWKATLIGSAMTLATATAGYISSHWGGVSSEQLKAAEDRIGIKVDAVSLRIAAESDALKKYVDVKIDSAEERLSRAKKKKQRSDEK